MQHAGRIVVLEEGRIEVGTQAELLARGGLYARLYGLQFAAPGEGAESGAPLPMPAWARSAAA